MFVLFITVNHSTAHPHTDADGTVSKIKQNNLWFD